MDRKSIIILVVCFLVMVLWYPLVVNKIYPPKPLPAGVTNVASARLTATNPAPTAPPPSLAEAPTQAPKPFVSTNVQEELVEVTNAFAHYTFTTHGGGLKEVQLLQYPETTSTRREKQPQTNRVATLNSFTPAPTLALLDGEAVQGDGVYSLSRTATGVRAEKRLTNGLAIVKDFQLSTNYLVVAKVRLENRSGQPLALPAQEWVVGTATPLDPRDTGQAVGMQWYNGTKSEDVNAAWFANRTLGCLPGTPRTEYRGGAGNVVWVAVHNQFFALAAMPQEPAQGVAAWKIDLPRPTGAEAQLVASNAPPPQGYEAALLYPAVTLAPNQSVERQIHLFAGPKEYQTLARIGDRFNNNIDQIMGYSGFFGFFAK
ncbi:MAG TPA: membrane protein insertase YidC, partial [Candidatus Sulfotelmatobacter sp.]|nr:membrane protein insertase YidC [Candidatus Sulfotelmatobacter sp.]